MTDHVISHTAFVWFMSLFTGLIAGTWLVYDALKLFWLRKKDKSDPTVHDKRFGYSIGMCVGLIGVLGVLKYHL
jgi:hypothetical protein